jgi:fatty acid amide hydrolase 2
MHEFCRLPITELARRVRTREVSPVDLLEVHIQRIEEVNPAINAVVATRYDDARAEAKACEARLSQGTEDLPPLFGVPCTIKELIAVDGMPWTAGVTARRDVVADFDAPQVARIRAAGAIIMGVTNISESGLWLESVNKIYGRTNNPWDHTRMAGGSTGGEAAIIAAGGSPFGLGADIGGSIRNPCFFNGIAGHKPSGGFLPAVGHWPPAEGPRGRYCVTGPMGRTVGDVITLMQVVSTEDDPHRDAQVPAFSPRTIRPEDVTVSWFLDNGTPLSGCDADVAAAMDKTVEGLASQGFRCQPWRPDNTHLAADMWGARIALTPDPSVRELLGNGTPISLATQWLRLAQRRADHQTVSLIMATFEGLSDLSESRTHALDAKALAMQAQIEDQLGPNGILLCPVYPCAAPRHRAPMLRPYAFSYCGMFNILELPSTAVPTGFDRQQLPLGLQVAGRRFDDALTLAVAEHIEQIWGGFQPAM